MKNLYRFLISGLPGKKILLFFVLFVAIALRAYSQCPTILAPLPQDKIICSGESTAIVLHSTIPYTTFNWKITGAKPNTVSGFSDSTAIADASGNYIIGQILVNGSNADHDFTYVITPVANGCQGTPVTVVITVKPKMYLTVTPPDPSTCSGVPVAITLTADVAGLTFSWTAIPSDSITGYTNGTQTSSTFDLPISQTLFNAGVLPHTVDYEVMLSHDGCSSGPNTFTVTVYPNPSISNNPLTASQCSGDIFILTPTSSTGSAFSWTTTSTSGTTGASAGSGSTINQKLTNTTSTPGTVTYSITPTANGCIGKPTDFIVTVNPIPTVTNSPMNQSICSGDQSTEVKLLSDVAGTTFTWIASASSSSLSGYQNSGSDIIPAQTILNSGLTSETITYRIFPISNSCQGLLTNYVITVNPLPVVTSSLVKEICSNVPFSYQISANLLGTTFSWVRNSVAGISNAASSGTTATISETLINTTSSDIDVTYLLTLHGPAPLLCTGSQQSLVVKVHALPQVSAGPDLTIKHGTSTVITGSVSGTAPLSYSWAPVTYIAGSSNTINLQTTNLYASQTFSLTSTNAFGCTNSSSMTVNVVGSPLATVPTATSSVICSGENTTLNVNASGGSENYTYSWVSLPAGFTSDKDIITVSPLVNTNYTVTVNDGYNKASATVSVIVNALPFQYPLSGGGEYCEGTSGALTGLSGSQSGVSYQLYKSGSPIGSPVAGTNSAISFGPQMAGTYTVVGTYIASGCYSDMSGTVTLAINPLPTIYEIRPMGSQCPGTIIWLNGSDKNVTYDLLLNGIPVASMAGTGFEELLGFGPQTANGTYTVRATNTVTGCQSIMNGSTYINIAPRIFSVIPAGILCPNRMISLTGSETGVNYQLRRNGTFVLRAPVPGTGSAIDMGIGDLPGIYSVIAVNATTQCLSLMADSATLYPDPVIYTILPDGPACEGDRIRLNGSQVGVNYILLLNNAIHLDTIQGTGSSLDFGVRLTAGNYSIIAVIQNSYCITQMNGVAVFNASPVKYDILPAGVVCKGNAISLSSSQRGISYQLFLNDITRVGSPVRGTGTAISFGSQTAVGNYTVQAVNDLTGCYAMMNGPVRLYPAPVTFQVAPTGNNCPGTVITLNGSEKGINYILLRDGLYQVDTLAGTGSPLSFGTPMIAGVYSVVARTVAGSCPSMMNGSSTIIPSMTIYNVTPTGFNCAGSVVGLDDSEIGVTYQLKRNGTENISSLAGTGSALNFGVMNFPGIYTVIGINLANSCVGTMNGKADIEPSPRTFPLYNTGIQCAGTEIVLSGSETGTYYVLMADGVFRTDTLDGTGGLLNFGPQLVTGTYTITAYNSLSGCKAAMPGSVTLIALPVTFNVYPFAMICAPAIIGLDGSQPGINYILYEDGNSTGATVAGTGNPINFGLRPAGNYTIEAVSLVSGCHIFMNSSIAAGLNINISATESCIGETTDFTPRLISPTGNVVVSYLWNFGDAGSGANNTSTLRQPSHKYSQQSTYIVTLTVQDLNKCTSTVYGQAVVYALPEPGFSYLEGNCDSTLSFKNLTNTNGTKVTKWIWQFGDGLTDTIIPPKSPDVSHAYSHSGEYYVTFTSINEHGCQASVSDTVRMFPCMVPEFRVNDTLVCQEKTITFSDMSSGGGPIANWHWDFGDGSILEYSAKKNTVDHTYKIPGTFNVKLVITTQIAGGIKSDSVTHLVTVNPSPVAEYSAAEACLGIAMEFKNLTTGNGSLANRYTWSFGESGTMADTSSMKDPSYVYRQAGDFVATLIATNTAGCSSTINHNVKVNLLPAAEFKYNVPCSGSQTHFTDGSEMAIAPLHTWKWDFLDSTNIIGHSDLRNPDFLFPKGGNFSARLTVTDDKGCKDASTERVVVYTTPVAAFSIKDYYDNVQGKVELSNQSLNASTFEWDFGNGSSSTDDEPVKIYDRDGSYIIRLIAFNEALCSDTLEKPYMLMFKGLYVPNAFSPESTFSNELLFKPVGMNLQTYQVEVFDSWGNLLWSSTKLDESGSPVESWDGTYKGNLLQQDVYIWKISAVFNDGTVWGSNDTGNQPNMHTKTSGTVTLLR